MQWEYKHPLWQGGYWSAEFPVCQEVWHNIIASLFSLSFSILPLFFVHLAPHDAFIGDIRGAIAVYYSLDGKKRHVK